MVTSYSKLLVFVLIFVLLTQVLAIVGGLFTIGRGLSQGEAGSAELFYGAFALTARGLTLYLVILLKQFFDSVQTQVFTEKNALRLDRISLLVFALGLIYAIETYPHQTPQVVELFRSTSGSLKHGVFAFIIIGFFIKFIADVFHHQTEENKAM